MYPPLISAAELHAQLHDPQVVIVDCRFDLTNPEAGRQAYLAGHIPNAIYAHLDNDLSGSKSAQTGRHPLPQVDTLAATFSRFGIDGAQRVVAYDADTGMFAARLWWLLRWMGHDSVAVLDGGLKGWQNLEYAITTTMPQARARTFTGMPQKNWMVEATEVALHAKDHRWRLLDARAPERFRGDIEPIDAIAGHIPGARNHPFAWNLNATSHFKAPAELSQKYRESLEGIAPDRAIVMCGLGVTACHTLLAMKIAGLEGAKLYAGSWSEWIRDPSRAIARGDAK